MKAKSKIISDKLRIVKRNSVYMSDIYIGNRWVGYASFHYDRNCIYLMEDDGDFERLNDVYARLNDIEGPGEGPSFLMCELPDTPSSQQILQHIRQNVKVKHEG
jgi:hypothetical protein